MDKILVTSDIFGSFYLERHKYYAMYNSFPCFKCRLSIVKILNIWKIDGDKKWAALDFECYNCKKETKNYLIAINKTDFKELKVIQI